MTDLPPFPPLADWLRCPQCRSANLRREAPRSRTGICDNCDYHWHVDFAERDEPVVEPEPVVIHRNLGVVQGDGVKSFAYIGHCTCGWDTSSPGAIDSLPWGQRKYTTARLFLDTHLIKHGAAFRVQRAVAGDTRIVYVQ